MPNVVVQGSSALEALCAALMLTCHMLAYHLLVKPRYGGRGRSLPLSAPRAPGSAGRPRRPALRLGNGETGAATGYRTSLGNTRRGLWPRGGRHGGLTAGQSAAGAWRSGYLAQCSSLLMISMKILWSASRSGTPTPIRSVHSIDRIRPLFFNIRALSRETCHAAFAPGVRHNDNRTVAACLDSGQAGGAAGMRFRAGPVTAAGCGVRNAHWR